TSSTAISSSATHTHSHNHSHSHGHRGSHAHCVKNKDVAKKLQHADWSLGPCPTSKMSGEPGEEMLGFSLTAFPNPLSEPTTISFRLGKSEKVTLKVYSLEGEEIATMFESLAEEGRTYEVEFKAGANADGMYFYRLITEPGEV